mmetsp:Transcript_40883/g.108058  ORF Transcript_40883/g.108058 Transcript_40883/m.108058 type:complete len:603 (-) Transcript_40883:232-2040(-)
MEGDLRVALLLQVGDDRVPRQLLLLDDANHLVKLLLVQAQLEVALSRVDDELAHLAFAVEAVQRAVGGGRNVERHLERADDAVVPVGQQVLEVVERREEEDVVAVPRAALHSDRVMHRRELLKLPRADRDGVLGDEGDVRAVGRPDDVLGRRHGHLRHRLALLNVVERHPLLGTQQQRARPCREEHVRRCVRRRAFLGDLVLKVFDENLAVLVEHGEALPRDEDRARAQPALAVRLHLRARAVLGDVVELIRASLSVERDEQHVLGLIVVHRAGDGGAGGGGAADAHHQRLLRPRVLVQPHVPILEEEDGVRERRVCRPLTLELEYDHAAVVAGGEEVGVGVSGEDPEAVVLAPERLHALPLRHVPHADRLVLRVRDDQLLLRMEERARDVVDVPAQRVDLPRLGLVHAPELDLPIVRPRDDQRQRVVEGCPVHAAVVPLEDVLDGRVVAAKEVLDLDVGHGLTELGGERARRHGLRGRGRRRALLCRQRVRQQLLAQPRDVPDAYGLVERGREHKVILVVELRAHDVVVVAGEDGDAGARLPVPNPDRLVVRRRHHPWVLSVELHCADVVEVAEEGEEAAAQLVVPHLDLVVIAAGDEEWL